MEAEEDRCWNFSAGPYLGEVSALALLPHSPLPILLAGCGSDLLFYDVLAGTLVHSHRVFLGIRVHGIAVLPTAGGPPCPLPATFSVAVFGERKVKNFSVCVKAPGPLVFVELVHALPLFDHWVLDSCFVEAGSCLAVGLCDNSVALWHAGEEKMIARVQSPEICLLYSMRIWGESIRDLRVASGTIYNQIIVWKLCPRETFSMEKISKDSSYCRGSLKHLDQPFMPIHLCRLIGHQGSIFRIAWSSDGSCLMSVSDDRSARIWITGGTEDIDALQERQEDHVISDHCILFGHSARIWDCYLSDSIAITCGEDCTCRVWGRDGSQLMVIKEHVGRGVWRCIYDSNSLLLVTAGFDAAIKAHFLDYRKSVNENKMPYEMKDWIETFIISAPKSHKQDNLMDSKSEYILCLRFTKENIVYVATNNGYLNRVKLLNSGDSRWDELARISEDTPVICMDLLDVGSSECSLSLEDVVALGDGNGNATILRLNYEGSTPRIVSCLSWVAEKERQLLGIHFCKSLGCSHIFTADPKGTVKLWKINNSFDSDSVQRSGQAACLISSFSSLFGARVMCLDVSTRAEVLICGDQRGNLTVFPLLNELLVRNIRSTSELEVVPSLDDFKGAHGISSVTSVLVVSFEHSEVDIRTTGGDGCICFFKYNKNAAYMEFTGMKQVKELSTIQSVVSETTEMEGLAHEKYAMGFISADFIMWDLRNELKTLEVPCGGWRRPYSYYLGSVPEYQNCFAYLKDHTIHIRRLWVPTYEKKLLPQVLCAQSHGREIHSLCFVTSSEKDGYNTWLATGCEDGTVRLTRYTPLDTRGWCSSKLLGEHVGGSAVRSLCFISTITWITHPDCISCRRSPSDCKARQFLLISAGAKKVLTSWVLRTDMPNDEKYWNGQMEKSEHLHGTCGNDTLSFYWLSSHMPLKINVPRRRMELLKLSQRGNASTQEMIEDGLLDGMENDWRYLAITAFLVKHSHCGLTICFVVIACSDATLILLALILPYRVWLDVALLVPQECPVLALQHVVVPINYTSEDTVRIENAHIIISGATDGNITFWDLTGTLETFIGFVTELQPELLVGNHKRPETGRGSQGGRLRRSLNHKLLQKTGKDDLRGSKTKDVCNSSIDPTLLVRPSSLQGVVPVDRRSDSQSCASDAILEIKKHDTCTMAWEVHQLRPIYVMNSSHQSGVNCLHVARFQSESVVSYCAVSGGDDQALHFFSFVLGMETTNPDVEAKQPCTSSGSSGDADTAAMGSSCGIGKRHHAIRVVHQDRIASAHCSAVKGVWTDGIWVFSAGLDQRIRCWKMSKGCKISEYAHLIVSVPEPEALDAMRRGRNQYQIAVAGRGMQIAEFSTE